jgi:UDP-N-acetylglucosamine--N-acetylmuramyl-(pentapeptide) pyrophosphoryl-undecaprenol N-acetylglucosamine transferase
MRAIIAAAGTAGHINPGIAIANKIKQEEKNSEILFIGTTRGLENDLVPRAGYELKTIDAYGLSKKISINSIKNMYKTYKGIGEAKKIIKDFKPDVVIGTGGYICGPVVMAASRKNIPVIMHESNAFPGKATKWLAGKAKTVLISFEEAREKLTKAQNIVYTGTPVKIKKQEYGINKKSEIIKQAGLKETKPIILIFGGSQGAKKINEAILEIIKNKLNHNYQIMWATGPKQYDNIKEELEKSRLNINYIENIKIVPYIYNMEELMNVSDIIVARSGAMTITEISNLGKPSILIPLPNVSGNHQLYNAKVLEEIGAARIILNDELNHENLNENIKNIVLNKNIEESMANNAIKISNVDAEEKIYNEIIKLVKEK